MAIKKQLIRKFLFDFKYYKGFTLSEVLITIAIIGIVAALTIPSLIQNTNNQQYKSSFKKTFSIISQASTQIKQDYGTLDNAFVGANIGIQANNMRTVYCKYLNCIKQADWDQQGNCASTDRYELDGTTIGSEMGQNRPCALLPDGTTLNFNWVTGDPLRSYIAVDTNGQKPPNTSGQDVFLIQVEVDERILPAGYQGGYYNLNAGNGACVKGLTVFYAGHSCAFKVITNTDY